MSTRRQILIGSAAVTAWYAWAFVHLLPPHTIVHGITLNHYRYWAFQHMAYSDIFALYKNHSLFNHALPYITTPIEYPVLMGVVMWIAGLATTALGFFTATTILIWISALFLHRWLVEWNPKTAWAFALTPMLLTYGLLNWDVMGIALMMWAIRLYHQKRYDSSAVMFAVAVFFKLFPVFYLPFIAAQLWRDGSRRQLGRMVALFSGASMVINLPFAVTNWANWSLFFNYNASRSVSSDIWNNLWVHISSVPMVDLISLTAVLATLVWTLGIVQRGGSVYHAAALLFAVFLLVNKVFSPQYMLWLFAYAALADWPIWSLGLLSLSGVIDYINSMAILHLVEIRGANTAAIWYANTIYPLGLLARYAAVVLSPVGGTLAARKDAAPVQSLPPHDTRTPSTLRG